MIQLLSKIFKTVLFCLLIILTVSCVTEEEKQAPNLLFVFSDQHTFDMLRCYGNDQIISPNIDKLASEGLMFRNCISNSPTCTPYRGMLMTGKYALHNGCFTNAGLSNKHGIVFGSSR